MNDVPKLSRLTPIGDTAVDRQKIRVTKSFLTDTKLIDSVRIEPTIHEPRLVRATVDDEFTPRLQSFELVSEWYLNEDFIIRLLETSEGAGEIYRWDNYQDDSSLETEFIFPGYIKKTPSFSGPPTRPIWVYMRILPEIEQYLSTL